MCDGGRGRRTGRTMVTIRVAILTALVAVASGCYLFPSGKWKYVNRYVRLFLHRVYTLTTYLFPE